MEIRVIVEKVGSLFIATALDDLGVIATAKCGTVEAAVGRVKGRAIIQMEDPDIVFTVAQIGGEQ